MATHSSLSSYLFCTTRNYLFTVFHLQATDGDGDSETVTMKDGEKRVLTGIPQIDYIYDPNLPRELNGYNLSKYPFLDSVPDEDDLEFKCDDNLKDGYYANIQYGCQVRDENPWLQERRQETESHQHPPLC